MRKYLQHLLARLPLSRPRQATAEFEARSAAEEPGTIYAIGDIHGCLDLLRQLEALLFEDAARRPGPKWLVMLGDYVDRGPQSAGVLDHEPHRAQIIVRQQHGLGSRLARQIDGFLEQQDLARCQAAAPCRVAMPTMNVQPQR